ncbi:SAM-dependent methyltransferase [Actinoplanes sp. NBRC 103695]|uniref:class I SAM-dependent methyltransferase n=1 Tax=Actinoplanes sp. NBRC 103695 TaxID=3032202 RepID=UPI0024A51C01|nr:SAM-dependent methyltransferase [Actinoplanes sp. NBRC 103695]GLY99430.1 methyltransferase [Actinoplanes sp. NBRC 103695]
MNGAFLREFLRNPLTVAAVAPSSERLADTVTAPVPHTGSPVVVELGPGTGSFTAAIQRRLGGRGRHLAVEINSRFAAPLAMRYPRVDVVLGDAARLRDVLDRRGIGRADVIVSGLPWAAFSAGHQDDLLGAVTDALAPDGVFTTFAYTSTLWAPAAGRLRRSLRDRFEEVVAGRTVWANLPPALVYSCRRPRIRPDLIRPDLIRPGVRQLSASRPGSAEPRTGAGIPG